jgi:hypothetical protein
VLPEEVVGNILCESVALVVLTGHKLSFQDLRVGLSQAPHKMDSGVNVLGPGSTDGIVGQVDCSIVVHSDKRGQFESYIKELNNLFLHKQ